jgi:hypothetical protein
MEALWLTGKDSFPVVIWRDIKWTATSFLEDPVGTTVMYGPPAAAAIGSGYALRKAGFSYLVAVPVGAVVLGFGSMAYTFGMAAYNR